MGFFDDPFDLNGDGKLDDFERAVRDTTLMELMDEDESDDEDDDWDSDDDF